MLLFDLIWETGKWLWEHRGESLSLAMIGSLGWVLVDKLGRKLITNQLKRLFHARDKSEFKTYTANQARIESKIDMLLQERGMVWDAHYSDGPKQRNVTALPKRNLLLRLTGSVRVRTMAGSTRLSMDLSHSRIRRESTPMKNYLKKLGRTKFQALLASLIINIVSAALFMNGTLDIDGVVNQWMPIINMTIGTISTWVYIAVEGSIDKANAQGGVNYDYSGLDAESKSAGTVESSGDSGYNRQAS